MCWESLHILSLYYRRPKAQLSIITYNIQRISIDDAPCMCCPIPPTRDNGIAQWCSVELATVRTMHGFVFQTWQAPAASMSSSH